MNDPHDRRSERRFDRDDMVAASLDRDRLASMADEGSVSGALMEIDDTGERKRLIETQRAASVFGRWSTVAAAFVLAGVAILIGVWLRRNA